MKKFFNIALLGALSLPFVANGVEVIELGTDRKFATHNPRAIVFNYVPSLWKRITKNPYTIAGIAAGTVAVAETANAIRNYRNGNSVKRGTLTEKAVTKSYNGVKASSKAIVNGTKTGAKKVYNSSRKTKAAVTIPTTIATGLAVDHKYGKGIAVKTGSYLWDLAKQGYNSEFATNVTETVSPYITQKNALIAGGTVAAGTTLYGAYRYLTRPMNQQEKNKAKESARVIYNTIKVSSKATQLQRTKAAIIMKAYRKAVKENNKANQKARLNELKQIAKAVK